MSSLLCLVLNCLLLTVLFPTATDQDCGRGWFGENCMLQCHCYNGTCDRTSGSCPSGVPCDQGYFGPGCQYVNVAFTDPDRDNPDFLMDENKTTCNNNAQATSVTLRLSRLHRTIWFRLHLKNLTSTFQHFIIAEDNKGNQCGNTTVLPVDANAVDVLCSHFTYANNITIVGDMAAEVCSIIVSGGRNVALKQETSQKSNAEASYGFSSAAVDGNTSSNERSCIKTYPHNNIAWWQVIFDTPHVLHRVVIYNNLAARNRLTGFKMMTGMIGRVLAEMYYDPRIVRDVYDIHLTSTEAIKLIMIWQNYLNPVEADRRFNFCEVQVYSHAYVKFQCRSCTPAGF